MSQQKKKKLSIRNNLSGTQHEGQGQSRESRGNCINTSIEAGEQKQRSQKIEVMKKKICEKVRYYFKKKKAGKRGRATNRWRKEN